MIEWLEWKIGRYNWAHSDDGVDGPVEAINGARTNPLMTSLYQIRLVVASDWPAPGIIVDCLGGGGVCWLLSRLRWSIGCQPACLSSLPCRACLAAREPVCRSSLSLLKNGTRPFCGSQASQYDTGRTPDLQRRWLAPVGVADAALLVQACAPFLPVSALEARRSTVVSFWLLLFANAVSLWKKLKQLPKGASRASKVR